MPGRRESARPNILYGVMLVALVALGGWWTILIKRLVEENYLLNVALSGPAAEVTAEFARKRLMLVGESVSLTVIALVLGGGIVAQARRERTQMRRLEGVLAASTHELKTPVAGVKALLESLQSGVLPPAQMGPHVARGLEACGRLEHLIESILAYQAAIARGQRSEARPLGAWVEGVLVHRLECVGEEGLAVELGDAGEIRVRAAVDPFRVVMENLLDNARKYGGGRPVNVRARADGSWVRLDVQDAGGGFEPGDAEALFEPYRRGTASDRLHGTGLGLYISRTLAREMGGDLVGASAGTGRGSTFTLSLRREAGA